MSCTHVSLITGTRNVTAYWYLSPPQELAIRCVTFDTISLRMLPPMLWINSSFFLKPVKQITRPDMARLYNGRLFLGKPTLFSAYC
ncbi:hypothetical protein L798_01034 [Zootermopsis nevadensis]|uniref:Uncharacterized protein n=1 Tax=Zootermopsis nevadensis TaxID=136037 RepID=A0A067QVL1_ZOONE|nr:hypothetical protein L798_01034 [Zootermopsis nevadensis]